MDIHSAHDLQRVHMRALGRLHQLHVEISSGRCPSIQDLAVSTGYTSWTIKRDVKAPDSPSEDSIDAARR